MDNRSSAAAKEAFLEGLRLADGIALSLARLRSNDNDEERTAEATKATNELASLVDIFQRTFSGIDEAEKERMLHLCRAANSNNQRDRAPGVENAVSNTDASDVSSDDVSARFEDIPSNVVVSNVFPFLRKRSDWNSFALANKDISCALKSQDDIIPPWPENCEWPQPPGTTELQRRLHSSRKAVWSSDGRSVVADNGIKVAVVSQRTGFVKEWIAHDRWTVTSISFAPNDKFIVSSGNDRHVKLWDCQNNYECKYDWDHLLGGTKDDPNNGNVMVLPDSESFVLLQEGSVSLVDASDGTIIRSLTLNLDFFGTTEILLRLHGQSVIFGGGEDTDEGHRRSEGTIKIWRFSSKLSLERSLDSYNISDAWEVIDLALSSDGTFLASATDEEVHLRKFDNDGSLEFVRKFNCRQKPGFLHSVSFTPCSKYLAAVGGEEDYDEGYLIFWDMSHFKTSNELTFNADMKRIRYSSKGICLLQFWDSTSINTLYGPDKAESENDEEGEGEIDNENDNVGYLLPRTAQGALLLDFGF